MLEINKIHQGDALDLLRQLDNKSINCCITSPPYFGLRDYGVEEQLGLEKTPDEFVNNLVKVFREVRRVLKPDGTLWLNLGDSYAGSGKGSNPDGSTHNSSKKGKQGTHKGTILGITKPQKAKRIGLKPKDLIGIPWKVAFALQADGWYLRQDIIWHKPNPMPESCTDRCTKSHEYIFLLSKSNKYYYNQKAIKESHKGDSLKRWEEDGKNKRSVWIVPTKPFKQAHFATFPPKLIEPCVRAGCPKDGIVLDPFMGAGTTAFVSIENNKNFIGFELNQESIDIANQRIKQAEPELF